METSLNNFKVQFSKAFASLLWKQWEKMGVAAWIPEDISWGWLIDPEALIFATSMLRDEDQRLFHVIREWVRFHLRYLHPARLRRIWKQYASLAKEIKISLPDQIEILERQPLGDGQRAREILSMPDWDDPSLLWLKLRAFLGATVRSDALVYFFYHPIGTTFAISREMFIDQKSVHDVLRMWESVGWVRRFGQRRGYAISASFRDRLLSLLGLTELPSWFNAGRVFIGMLLVLGALQRFAEHQDAYLLSSHLRDVLPLLQEIWELTSVSFPNPASYPGKAFAPVFLKSLLEVCQQLGRFGRPKQAKPSKMEVLQKVSKAGGERISFTEHEMYESAYRALRRRYPANKGWEIIPQFEGNGYRPDFVVQRRDWQGTIHRVIAEVKAVCEITRNHIEQLNRYARNLTGPNVQIDAKILIVPSGARSRVKIPESIKVIYLKSFGCSGIKYWIKSENNYER